MFKIVVFLAAGFFLYKMIMGDQKKKMEQKERQKENMTEAGEMVKDPVCGTYVSTDSEIRVKQDGKVYYFCSYECRDEFLKEQE